MARNGSQSMKEEEHSQTQGRQFGDDDGVGAGVESPRRDYGDIRFRAGGGRSPAPAERATTTTFADDRPGPMPYIRRHPASFRKGSFMTDSSSRPSIGPAASTDSLFLPRASLEEPDHDEPTLWHSAPLLFAVLPAIGGVVFKSGSIVLTDVTLLILAALYLNWCLATPWVWYRSAQTVKVDPGALDGLGSDDDAIVDATVIGANGEPVEATEAAVDTQTIERVENDETRRAMQELRLHEITALAFCFLGPLVGSYILHVVRSQLSTVGDQLVSNLHLTLFVLGAEVRPLRHAIKMAQARTLFLQRIVREDPRTQSSDDGPAVLRDIRERLDEVEAAVTMRLAENEKAGKRPTSAGSAENAEAIKKAQAASQAQIDALNRAVRRYEKRATAQTIQTEGRLQDLDLRLREAVSLAAAAATYSTKSRPGIVETGVDGIKNLVLMPIRVLYTTFTYPFQLVSDAIVALAVRLGIVQVNRKKKTSAGGKAIPSINKPRASRLIVSNGGGPYGHGGGGSGMGTGLASSSNSSGRPFLG